MVGTVTMFTIALRVRRKLFTFMFGLIHGFGFAGVLSELDLPVSGFVAALLQCNLGVEAGRLLIVTVALVLLFAWRKWDRAAMGPECPRCAADDDIVGGRSVARLPTQR